MAFTKVAATPEQLLAKLESRGLLVPAATKPIALSYLRFVGGYRLKGYWFHAVDQNTKQFKPQYTFEKITDQVEFDRELRAATIEAIDRLEVAIRTVMANFLSIRHSPHWFLKAEIFKSEKGWSQEQLVIKIQEKVNRAKEKRFVKHYYAEYNQPTLPPSWSISECVSFGLWSRTFSILKDSTDKKAISMRFGVDQVDVFQSWIHTLTVVRNVAAHHGQLLRVWQRVTPAEYKAKNICFSNPKTFYASAIVIYFLLEKTNLPHRWKNSLESVFAKYPSIELRDLGFPSDWKLKPEWK